MPYIVSRSSFACKTLYVRFACFPKLKFACFQVSSPADCQGTVTLFDPLADPLHRETSVLHRETSVLDLQGSLCEYRNAKWHLNQNGYWCIRVGMWVSSRKQKYIVQKFAAQAFATIIGKAYLRDIYETFGSYEASKMLITQNKSTYLHKQSTYIT